MSKRKDTGTPSERSNGLPKVERFDLLGRQEPKVRREQFERTSTLTSVVKKGLLSKEGLAPTYSQLGAYYLNLPHLSTEVWRTLFIQIRDYVSDFNREQRKWFFDIYPQLLLVDGAPAFDIDSPVDALVQFAHQYYEDSNELLAAHAMASAWLNVDGKAELSRRISAALKPTLMRSLFAQVGTIPIMGKAKDYILNATKVLRYDGIDDTISIYLPVWLDSSTAYVDIPPAQRVKPNWERVPYDGEYDLLGPVYPIHKVGNESSVKTWNAATKKLLGVDSNGLVAGSLFRNVELRTKLFVKKYRATMMSPDSQICRAFVDMFKVFDSTVKYDEVVNSITNNAVVDALSFAKTHQKYWDLPGPVPLLFSTHKCIAGVPSPFVDDNGNITEEFTYRPSSLKKTIAQTAMDFLSKTSPVGADILPLGNYMAVVTKDPDELEKVRQFAILNSGTPVVLGSSGRKIRDISFDWTKWQLIGADGSIGKIDTSVAAISATAPYGASSISFATGARQIGSDPQMGHVGHMPIVVNFLKLLASNMVTYTGKPGQTVKDLLDMTGDRGHWCVNIEEVERGIIRPYYVMSPLVNNRDYAQCGFYNIISIEDVVDSTGKVQPNRWSHWFKFGLKRGSALSLNKYVNPWSDSTISAEVKDGSLFIGDAIGLTPESHFMRIDIAPAYYAAQPNDGCWYPIKPFVNRALSTIRSPKYTEMISGRKLDDPSNTVEVTPAECILVADTAITDSFKDAHLNFIAWMFWLPDLVFDEDHPIPESLYGYIEEGQSRMDAIFNGKGFFEIAQEVFQLTQMRTSAIDEAIKRVLKIEPKLDKKNLPASYSKSGSRSFPSRKARSSQGQSRPTSKFNRDVVSMEDRSKEVVRPAEMDKELKGVLKGPRTEL